MGRLTGNGRQPSGEGLGRGLVPVIARAGRHHVLGPCPCHACGRPVMWVRGADRLMLIDTHGRHTCHKAADAA